jgi:phospholipid transport system substrate-binding protein
MMAVIRCAALICVLTGVLVADVALAAEEPAISAIEALHGALEEAMKGGTAVSSAERFDRLKPVIERVFDLPAMTAFAVGPAWASFSAADQQATVTSFERLTVASYAHNFRQFNGERFEVASGVVTRGQDEVVQSRLLPASGAPVNLSYRLRATGGAWRIIDVYYGAVSQLTIRRADFSASVAAGGAQGLIAHMNELSDAMLK